MRVAVVGAGLAGLALSWYLSSYPHLRVVLFDPLGIGQGASGVSTGLLHPFPGKRALKSWCGVEAMQESFALLKIAEEGAGRKVYEASGIVRPAINAQQKKDFREREEAGLAEWREGGLWIPSGATVYSRLYLEALWKRCEGAGVQLIKQKIEGELEGFDQTVFTTGFETLKIAGFQNLPLEVTRGQALLCRVKEPLACSLSSYGHISKTEEADLVQVGSTYERGLQWEPEKEVIAKLLDQAALFYPEAKHFEVLEVRAGARIARPKGYRPFVMKREEKTWLFTGLGSRGLLYHAFFAKKVAESVANRLEWEA